MIDSNSIFIYGNDYDAADDDVIIEKVKQTIYIRFRLQLVS